MTTRRARLQVKPNISGPKGPVAGRPLSNLGITRDVVPDASNQTVGCPKPDTVDALPVISNVDTIQKSHSSDKNEVLINSADGLVKEPTALDLPGKIPDVAEVSHSQVTNVILPSRARFRRFGKVNLSAIKDTIHFGDHRRDALSDSRLLPNNNVTVTESTKSDSLQNEAVIEDTTKDQTHTPEKATDHDCLHAINKIGETNLEKSFETRVETNTEKPVETCIERSVEASIEMSVETCIERSVETITKRPVKASSEKSVKANIENFVEGSIEKSFETSIERSVETDVDKHFEPNRDINNKEKMVPDIPSHAIQGSRFAKAKPNIVDARRKQNESMKENVPKLSITEENKQTTPMPPKIAITPADPDSVFTECANIPCPPDPAEYMTQIRSSSLHVPKSPIRPGVSPLLTSPVKTVVDSHDKRYKVPTHNQAEPIIKRARKHKIDAPTDQPPDKSIMKMRDLIHWNPSNNPMKLNDKLSTKIISGMAEKENVDKKMKAAQQQNNGLGTSDMEDDNALPVPQVTIGPDGNIVINKTSLVVKVPDLEKDATQEPAVIDETDLVTTYSSFRRTNRSSRWSKRETLKFYKALAMIGTDFFLINKLFPKRNRFEIKKKFKREEKINSVLMEKALKERLKFDPDVFRTKDDELSSSSDENNKITKQRKKKVKEKVDNCKDEDNKNKLKRNKSRKRHNYYEMDLPDSEPEDSSVIGDDPTCESPNVSRTDGEVVGILMDTSEGHLAAGNQESSDIYIATPVVKNGQARGKALPGSRSRTKEMINNKQKTAGVHVREGSNDVIPQADARLSVHAPHRIEHRSDAPDCYAQPQTSRGSVETPSDQLQFQVPAYVDVPSMVTDPSDSLQGAAVQNQQIQYSFMGNNYGMITPIGLPVVNSHATSLVGLPANQGDGDQYVLVTVLSENGQETVIHIYRLHGGIQPTVVVENMDMTTIHHSDCSQMGNIDNVQIEGTENTINIDKVMNENNDHIHVGNIENTHMEAMDTSHTENVQNIQIVNAHTLNMDKTQTESVDTLHLDNIQTQTESVDTSHKDSTRTESVHMDNTQTETKSVDMDNTQAESVATSHMDNTQTESVHTEIVDMDNTQTETESIHTSHMDNTCYTAIKCIDNTIVEDRECTILDKKIHH